MWTVTIRDAQGKVVAERELAAGSLTIGRDQGRDLVLPSKGASRKHARVDLLNGVPVIVDEGSANGTLVNGARIQRPTRIDENARVEIAEFRISVARPQPEIDPNATVVLSRLPPRPAAPPLSPPPAPKAAAPAAAPPPPPVARPPSPAGEETPLGRIVFPEPEKPKAGGVAPAADTGSATAKLDQAITSIRSHREQTHTSKVTRAQQLEASWKHTVVAMQQLKVKLAGDKRVLDFAISRDEQEISLKIADKYEKRGYRYFLLARRHPEGKFGAADCIWLLEFGRDDATFDDGHKAMEELLLRVAGTLA